MSMRLSRYLLLALVLCAVLMCPAPRARAQMPLLPAGTYLVKRAGSPPVPLHESGLSVFTDALFSPDGTGLLDAVADTIGERLLLLDTTSPDEQQPSATLALLDAGDRITRLAWALDGQAIAFVASAGLQVVAPDGSGLTLVAAAPVGRRIDRIAWSPDARWIAFSTATDTEIVRPDGRDDSVVSTLGTESLAWAPDSQSLALAQKWSLSTNHTLGSVIRVAVPSGIVAAIILQPGLVCGADLTWSPDGTYLAFHAGVPAPDPCGSTTPDGTWIWSAQRGAARVTAGKGLVGPITWIDATHVLAEYVAGAATSGAMTSVIAASVGIADPVQVLHVSPRGTCSDPQISGASLLVNDADSAVSSPLAVIDTTTGAALQLKNPGTVAVAALLAPQSDVVAWTEHSFDFNFLFLSAADGTAQTKMVLSALYPSSAQWSPDGQSLLVVVSDRATGCFRSIFNGTP